MLVIRDEVAADVGRVRQVTMDAFASSEFGHQGEADLVDCLRAECSEFVSLVACKEDHVVGHILLTPVVIRSPKTEVSGMGLAPLSVAAAHQRQGIGTQLVTESMQRLFEAGCPFIVVLGHRNYYQRFGFRPALERGVTHGFQGIPQDGFHLLTGAGEPLEAIAHGQAFYCDLFGPQHVPA